MKHWVRLFILTVFDATVILLSVYLSYLLRFDFKIKEEFLNSIPFVAVSFSSITIIFLYFNRIYKRMWRYASVGDLISILKGIIYGTGFFFILQHFVIREYYEDLVIPRSIFILTSIITFLGIAGSRFIWRIIRDNYTKIQPHHQRALIVGAGETGIMVVKELKKKGSEYYPVAFIDDDVSKKNHELLGVPVVGGREEIEHAVKSLEINSIILAIPSASRMEVANILDICKKTGCQIKIIPKVNDLINGKISINMIRDVNVEDLLGRDPVSLDLNEIAGYLNDKVVLVTGAGGSIGSELCRQISLFGPKQLLLLGHGENSIYEIEMELRKKFSDLNYEAIIADIQDRCRMREVFEKYRPEVVFHAAAHKHVPMMERNPVEAVKNNILGTNNVVDCADEYGVERFIMISTDKAVNPTNVMGATKRVAEMIVQSKNQVSDTIYAAVRFGNVLGSRGSVIPVFKKQIEEGGPVTVTHPEMIRYFMTIPEAVQLVIQAGSLAHGGEVFILDMGNPVKIADLAKDLIRLSGLEPNKDIKIVYTGIRPGEKLYEELLTSEEGTAGTKHDRIYIGKLDSVNYSTIEQMLADFKGKVKLEGGSTSLISSLHYWVPTFKRSSLGNSYSKKAVEEAIRASFEVVASINDK